MDLVSRITLLGGAGSRAQLLQVSTRRELDRAVRDGTLVRVARGRYALSSASDAVRAATQYGGVISHRSAAQRHGWGLRLVPALPDVTFPRTYHLDPRARRVLVPHWSDIDPVDIERGATGRSRTLVDCLRNLPLADALAVADSALRADDITGPDLRRLAESMRGCGRTRAIGVAQLASGLAANPFESALRAIASTVPGLLVQPQFPLDLSPRRTLHPDLYDERLGIVVEAEGFAWHGDAPAFTRDCKRYNAFVARGLIVVRFSWRQAVFEPAYVVRVLSEAVAVAQRHADVARVARGKHT